MSSAADKYAWPECVTRVRRRPLGTGSELRRGPVWVHRDAREIRVRVPPAQVAEAPCAGTTHGMQLVAQAASAIVPG